MPRRPSHFAFAVLLAASCLAFTKLGPHASALQIHHGVKKDMKRQVEELEEQWRTAQLNGDALLMDKLLSDDYVGISMTGQVNTKSQQLDRLRSRALTLTRIDLSDVKVKLVGTVAIVTSRADVVGINDGQPMTGIYRYTRVYQRLPSGTWKITNFEATRVPNGRPTQSRPDTVSPAGTTQ